MKKLILFVIILSFLYSFASAQNSEANSADLQEAERLNKESGRMYSAGQFDKALGMELTELALREKIGDEQYIATVKFNIGGIYREKGDLAKSIKYYKASLVNYRRAFGENHIKVFNALSNLAHVLILKDEYTESAETMKTAMLIAEKIYGKESQQVAELYLSQAQLFWKINKIEESEAAYRQSIFASDKLLKSTADINRLDVSEYTCFLAQNFPSDFSDKFDKFYDSRNQAFGEKTNASNIVNSKATKLIRPELPLKTSIPFGGVLVIMRVTIDAEGNVISAKPVCGNNSDLSRASMEAAYKSKFTPTLENGVPIVVSGFIVYKFNK
jgi:tetratricopeptide (TPR) repeat protein